MRKLSLSHLITVWLPDYEIKTGIYLTRLLKGLPENICQKKTAVEAPFPRVRVAELLLKTWQVG